MKIKRTTVTKHEQEVEVSLPYFSKKHDSYYAIWAEDKALRVHYWQGFQTIATIQTCPASEAYGDTEITAKEFEDAYVKANDYLSEQFEAMRDKTIEKATL